MFVLRPHHHAYFGAAAQPQPQPPAALSAKERYLQAIAEEKAARRAYADALAEEEVRKLEARALRHTRRVHFTPDVAPVYDDEDLEWAHAQCIAERRRAAERDALRRAAEEDAVRRVAEQHALRRAAEQEARRQAAEQEVLRRRAEDQRRAARVQAYEARVAEQQRAHALAFARALKCAIDAANAEQQEERKDIATTPGPAAPAIPVPVAATTPVERPAAADKGKGKAPSTPPSPVLAPATDPLSAIAILESSFDALSAAFTFPAALDFASATAQGAAPALAYSPRNAPVHAYEAALGRLLTRLDAVESAGVDDIRAARKRVVHRVEAALAAVDARVQGVWRDMWSAAAQRAGAEEHAAGSAEPVAGPASPETPAGTDAPVETSEAVVVAPVATPAVIDELAAAPAYTPVATPPVIDAPVTPDVVVDAPVDAAPVVEAPVPLPAIASLTGFDVDGPAEGEVSHAPAEDTLPAAPELVVPTARAEAASDSHVEDGAATGLPVHLDSDTAAESHTAAPEPAQEPAPLASLLVDDSEVLSATESDVSESDPEEHDDFEVVY